MTGSLPVSENASIVMAGRFSPFMRHKLCFASRATVSTPSCEAPAVSIFGFGRTAGNARVGGAEPEANVAAANTTAGSERMGAIGVRRFELNAWTGNSAERTSPCLDA